MKRKKFMLFLGWCTIVLNCIFMLWQRVQLITILLWLFGGGLITALFVIERKEIISNDIRKAIAFSFDVGVFYLVFNTLIKCIDIVKSL